MNSGRRLLVIACSILVVVVGIMFLAAALFAPFGPASDEGWRIALLGAVFLVVGIMRFGTLGRLEGVARVLDVVASALASGSALWAFGSQATRVDGLSALTIAACLILLVEALLRPSYSASETRQGR